MVYNYIPRDQWKRRGPVPKDLPEETQKKINSMLRLGIKKKDIAKHLGITYYKLTKYLKKMLNNPQDVPAEVVE